MIPLFTMGSLLFSRRSCAMRVPGAKVRGGAPAGGGRCWTPGGWWWTPRRLRLRLPLEPRRPRRRLRPGRGLPGAVGGQELADGVGGEGALGVVRRGAGDVGDEDGDRAGVGREARGVEGAGREALGVHGGDEEVHARPGVAPAD